MAKKSRRKVRYAVVGLGWFAQAAVLPAFANAADNSELAALFTGDPEKAKELSDKYDAPAYHYDDYDKLLAGTTPSGPPAPASTSCARSRWPIPPRTAGP
jgi:predicted dehydrogenase